MISILLCIGAIIILIGIIRIICSPYEGFWSEFLKLLLLDYLCDILQIIIDLLFDND